jgi:tRNA 2-thiouridine synthesizing protein A
MTAAGDPDIDIDARGLQCPLPVLRLRKRLLTTAPGQVVRMLASDPMAAVDVPHFCAGAGHELVAQAPCDGGTLFTVRAGRR